ncbi:Uncharacterised protein [Bordetella pertussis]|nr:Uncharacterised protein [Bordetella pertussis]
MDSAGFLTSYRYMSWITRPSGRMLALRMIGSLIGSSRILSATTLPSVLPLAATARR